MWIFLLLAVAHAAPRLPHCFHAVARLDVPYVAGEATAPEGVLVWVWGDVPRRLVREEYHYVRPSGGYAPPGATIRSAISFKDYASGKHTVVVDRFRDALVAAPASCVVIPVDTSFPLAPAVVDHMVLNHTGPYTVHNGLGSARDPVTLPHVETWLADVDYTRVVVRGVPLLDGTLHPVALEFPSATATLVSFEEVPCQAFEGNATLFDAQAHSVVRCGPIGG